MEKRRLNRSIVLCMSAIVTVILAATGIISCSKSGAGCFRSAGTLIQQQRPADDFDTIIARENPDVIITQDSINSVVVEAGENIIKGVTTSVSNRQLQIGCTNSCNWVRSYDKPVRVYVHAKNLRKIWYLSAGNISTTNTLNVPSLALDVWGGCGSINMAVNLNQGYFYEHLGTADITIRGRSMISSVSLGDFGSIQLKDLSTDYSYVLNTGTNDCYVNACKVLDATIRSIGNIYYTGKPDSIHAGITGEGKLIEF